MKELSIEEKARRYDEAIERAKNYHSPETECNVRIAMENLFPELKESVDERVRNFLIDFIKVCGWTEKKDQGWPLREECIAWLEKQVPSCLSHDDEIMIRQLTEYFTTGKVLQNTNDTVVEWLAGIKRKLEKQGEQKHTDKVEPKFKVGDWIVCCDYEPIQIIGIRTNVYEMSNGDIRPFYMIDNNHNIRIWTIQDAKDGDVLVADNGSAFIYNGYLEEQQYPFAYGGINMYGRFNICGGLLPFTHQKVVPATKEQRDTLMKAMTDAGYEWDAKLKQLKNIEQNPAWSEEDEQYLLVCKNALAKYQTTDKWDATIISQWLENKLKSLEYRVQPQPKQEWSEEDIATISRVISIVKWAAYSDHSHPILNDEDATELVERLKSLEDRYTWKPSDNQMKALNAINVTGGLSYVRQAQELIALYNDLKKLREKLSCELLKEKILETLAKEK